MKKLIPALAIFLLIHHNSKAQVLISLVFGDQLNTGKIEFGLDGGMSLSNLAGAPGAENLMGFNLGFYFDIKTKNPNWKISTGVVVKGPMGAKGIDLYSTGDPILDQAFEGGSVTRRLGYFYVPMTMKYSLKNRIYFKGGIQLGLINKAVDEFTKSVEDDDDLTYKLKRKGDFHPIDAGLVGGVGYRISKGYGMNIGINYYHGMLDASVSDASPDQFNRVWYFNVGIPIGKGKAEKKAKAAAEKNK